MASPFRVWERTSHTVMNQQLEGTALIAGFRGEPSGTTAVPYADQGVAPVVNGVPYVPKVNRDKRCRAKNNTCMGWATKEDGLCYGCARSAERKAAKAAKVAEALAEALAEVDE